MAGEEIHITGFNPLRVSIPKVDVLVGKIKVVLPDVHVKLLDLSGGFELLKGAHVGADGPAFSLDFDIPEPGIPPGKFLEGLYAAQEPLEEMWKVAQRELDKAEPLLG